MAAVGRAVALGYLLAAGLPGAPRGVRPWDDVARAPVLAVAQVEGVSPGPAGTTPRRTCTAKLRVLRAFGRAGGETRIEYPCYLEGAVIMGGPDLTHIEKGRVYLFPLDGAKLFREDERLYPVIEAVPEGAAASRREFLLREVANVLLRGSYPEMVAVGVLPAAMADELMPRLRAVLREGDARWLDIATSQLAGMGIPRQPLPERGGPVAAHALMRLKPERRAAGVVEQMLRYSDVHGWGSAATLIPEYKDHPLLLRLLPGYLAKGQPGALNIAWWAARNGQPAVLPGALVAALSALRGGTATSSDRNAAAALLVDYGSDAQFAEFMAIFAAGDGKGRYLMWQAPYADKGRRALRMIAALLADERIFSGGMRFCDLAGARFQELTGQRFGFTSWNQDIAGRNAALAKARRWIATSSGLR